MAKRVGRLIMRAACIVGIGAALGLVANAVHPMRLPLALGEVEGPGIPRWVWESVTVVNVSEAKAVWDEGDVVFIDTRNLDDQPKGTVPGSVALPFRGMGAHYPEFKERWDREATYLLYCYGSHCGLAMRMAKVMLRDGYENLIILRGGIAMWETGGYPIEPWSEATP